MSVPPHLFRWKRLGKKTSPEKMQVKNGDIDQWRKRVEAASEFAVSEVLSHNKPRPGTSSLAVPLQRSDQLRDHDDAYSEAQALLGDWLSSKLRLELEEEEEDEEDDLMRCGGRNRPAPLARPRPAALNHNNFDDLYSCLAEEEEHSAVSSVLRDLMEQEVLDSAVMEELALDVGQTRKKFRDPVVAMEARHLQVRESRARREAERRRQQGEREARRGALAEAKRREQDEETRRKQWAQRQEEMVQKEMVRLRRQMEERRGLEQLVRLREREHVGEQRAARSLHSAPPPPTEPQPDDTEQLYRDHKLQTMLHMGNLKCLQRHFSGWYSVVLGRRLRLGKAMALCDWKRQLRAWRAWRALVWAEQQRREVTRTEEDLRAENRQCQLAAESDRRRLLRRCLNEWQRWCRMEKDQRELLAQQQETRRRMAALINAAATGKLKSTEAPTLKPSLAPPEASNPRETTGKEDHASAVHQKIMTPVDDAAQPTQPWRITRRHAAPSAAELHAARQRGEGSSSASRGAAVASAGGRFENRHAIQQQIITQQRKQLKEQQEQITRMQTEQRVKVLGMEKTPQEREASCRMASRVPGEAAGRCAPPRKAVTRQISPHPIITAMEVRAHRRAQRRKEIEELKRKKEEENLAEMKAAAEERQREEEEEKRKAAEKKREEKRLQRERDEEKQKQLKRQQELLKLAGHHYHRNLLLRRGLSPWKRLMQLRQANTQLAESHHNLALLRRCTRGWQQSAGESLSEREASADQLQRHFLLRRSLSCWKRLKERRPIQEERAERFYRARTLRRVLLALLDYVDQERLLDWDRQELAQQHDSSRVLRRCFLAWRRLPCLQREERAREVMREKLGRRVAEVLPDFCSNLL